MIASTRVTLLLPRESNFPPLVLYAERSLGRDYQFALSHMNFYSLFFIDAIGRSFIFYFVIYSGLHFPFHIFETRFVQRKKRTWCIFYFYFLLLQIFIRKHLFRCLWNKRFIDWTLSTWKFLESFSLRFIKQLARMKAISTNYEASHVDWPLEVYTGKSLAYFISSLHEAKLIRYVWIARVSVGDI